MRTGLRGLALAAAAVSLVAATVTWRTVVVRPSKVGVAPPATMTSPPSPASSPAGTIAGTEGRAPSVAPRAPVIPQEPVAVATVRDELMAVAALHQIGADLGDPVEVARENGKITVKGSGLSAELQQRIRDAMALLPRVAVQFSETPLVPTEPPASVAVPTAPRIPDRLAEQLGGRAQFESFSSQLLDHNEAAMTRAYALRRLAQQFPAEAELRLDSADQALLHRLGREHLEVLRSEFATVERLAAPVLSPLGAATAPQAGVTAASWQAAEEGLFRSARLVETRLTMLLGAAAPDQPAAGLPGNLAVALAQLQQDVQQCERLLTR